MTDPAIDTPANPGSTTLGAAGADTSGTAGTPTQLAKLFLGLRTAIYPAPDLAAAKGWVTTLLGIEPYFDTDFYVGYSVAGYEFALDPHGDPERGAVTYWGVPDADAVYEQLVKAGATPEGSVDDVGDRIRTATFALPHLGGSFGIIENPHFELPPELPGVTGAGR